MTTAPMHEAELLAALRAPDGKYYHEDPTFRLQRPEALTLLRSQIAAHRREERERCEAACEGVPGWEGEACRSAIRALPDLPTTEREDG